MPGLAITIKLLWPCPNHVTSFPVLILLNVAGSATFIIFIMRNHFISTFRSLILLSLSIINSYNSKSGFSTFSVVRVSMFLTIPFDVVAREETAEVSPVNKPVAAVIVSGIFVLVVKPYDVRIPSVIVSFKSLEPMPGLIFIY